MSEIDEAMVSAWADGELDEISRRRLEQAAAADPALAARLDQHRRLRERLSAHYAPILHDAPPEPMRRLLEDAAVVTPMTPRGRSAWPRWAVGGALAASLALGLVVGRVSGGGEILSVGRDGLIARGDLASALDTQLASAQGDAPYRIGLSFRRKEGGWCRTFDSAKMAGLACREDAGWQLQQVVPGAGDAHAYRQARSADARIMATVDSLMTGDVADPAAERAALERGWQ